MDLMAPYLEKEFSEPMREVASSTMQALLNGKISSFHEIDEHFKSELLKRPYHFGHWGSPMSEDFSTLCRSGAAMFANQSVTWLERTLEDSASRVVSRDWADGVDRPNTRKPHDALTLATDPPSTSRSGPKPGLDKSATARKGGRRKKASPEALSSTCPKCGRTFNQKYHKDHLRRHLRWFHSDKYITCQFCERKLKYRKDNVAKHLRIRHPGQGGSML
jgi:hypothetical protein